MEQHTTEIKTNWLIGKKAVWGLKEKLFLLLIVSAVAVFAGQAFEDTVRQVVPEQEVFRSVVNKKASGHSALLAVASQSQLPCQMWLLPYRRLGTVKGLLYAVQPNLPWTEAEVKEILAWVKQGNQLIYFDSFFHEEEKLIDGTRKTKWHPTKKTSKKLDNSILLHKLGLSIEWLDNHAVICAAHLPEMAHVKTLLLKTEVKIIGGQPLVACKDGAYITAVKYGSGKILLGSVPQLCANETLKQVSNYDNFQFMINCFRTTNGAILFDEYCHGIQGEGNVFVYFSRRLPGLICLQLLFMLIPAVLSTNLRFGALKTFKTSRQISDLAYVFGLANVYKRAQANLVALESVVGFWKTKLCRQLGLSARASANEILQRAKDSNIEAGEGRMNNIETKDEAGGKLSQLSDFLGDYEEALTEDEISKARLTNLISQCDALKIKVR